jgi:hypothetical protein
MLRSRFQARRKEEGTIYQGVMVHPAKWCTVLKDYKSVLTKQRVKQGLVGALDLKLDTLFAYYLSLLSLKSGCRFGAHGVPVIAFF